MYRHILIPTDGSALAEHGVAHGVALAKSLHKPASATVEDARLDLTAEP